MTLHHHEALQKCSPDSGDMDQKNINMIKQGNTTSFVTPTRSTMYAPFERSPFSSHMQNQRANLGSSQYGPGNPPFILGVMS